MAKGALSRMANVIRAEVDDFVSKLEDPKKMVRQMILDMEEALDEAVVAVGRAVANEKMLERKLAAKHEECRLWEDKAEAALNAGQEELARRALQQKVAVEEMVKALDAGLEDAREVSQTLKQQLSELKVKLESAKSRQGALVIQKGAAKVRSDLRADSRLMNSEAFARYDQFCQEIAREEITAQVYAEVAGVANAELDGAFDRLELQQKVDAQMQALKDKVKKDQGQS